MGQCPKRNSSGSGVGRCAHNGHHPGLAGQLAALIGESGLSDPGRTEEKYAPASRSLHCCGDEQKFGFTTDNRRPTNVLQIVHFRESYSSGPETVGSPGEKPEPGQDPDFPRLGCARYGSFASLHNEAAS